MGSHLLLLEAGKQIWPVMEEVAEPRVEEHPSPGAEGRPRPLQLCLHPDFILGAKRARQREQPAPRGRAARRSADWQFD